MSAAEVGPDRDAIAVALDAYLDAPGEVSVFALYPDGGNDYRSFPTSAEGLEKATDWVIERDQAGAKGVYVRGTTVRPGVAGRGDDDDTDHHLSYRLDLDYGQEGYAPDEDTVWEVFETAGLPEPTGWENSGHGFYPTWRLARPVADTPDVRALALAIHARARAAFVARGYKIDTCTDAARVWRIPGTVNRKDPDAPVLARALTDDGPVYAWGDLREAVAPPAPPSTGTATPAGSSRLVPGKSLFGDGKRFTDAEAGAYVATALGKLAAAAEGERNKVLNNTAYVVGHFAEGWDLDLGYAVDRLTPIALDIGLEPGEIGPTVRSGFTAGTREPYERVSEAGGTEDADLAKAVRQERVRRQARAIVDAELAPPRRPAATTSLADLLAEPDADVRHRIEGLWPVGGKVILTAPQKAGKTTLVGNLIRCLVDGDRFLATPGGHAGFAVAPLALGRRVTLLDFEMTRSQLRDWLRDQGIHNTDAVHVELLRGARWDPRDDETRAEWAARLAEVGTDVLLIDPLGPILHGLELEENGNTAVGSVLTALDRLVAEAGASELAVSHHTGHDGERTRGASVLRAWPDATWTVVREEERRFFSAEGRDVLVAEKNLSFDRATRRLGLGTTGGRAEVRANGDAETIAAIVEESPGRSFNALKPLVREALECGTPVAEKAIRAARKAHAIHVHHGANKIQQHYPGPACEDCPDRVTPGDPG